MTADDRFLAQKWQDADGIVADDATLSRVWFAPVGTAAPTVAELQAGTSFGTHSGPDVAWQPLTERYSEHFGDTRPTRSPAEFVQYADDILEAVGYDPMYPEPHEHTDEPWPYRGF